MSFAYSHMDLMPLGYPNVDEPHDGKDEWVLEDDWALNSAIVGYHLVRAGFRYDGASIPQFFWRLIGHPMEERFRSASLAHDELLKSQQTSQGRRVTRRDVDQVFREVLMGEPRVRRWERVLMYWAVRAGSWKAWNHYRSEGSSL